MPSCGTNPNLGIIVPNLGTFPGAFLVHIPPLGAGFVVSGILDVLDFP